MSHPSLDVYDKTTVSTISAILTGAEGYHRDLKRLVGNLGIGLGASAEQWVLAAYHLECLYRHFRDIRNGYKSTLGYNNGPLSPPPSSKRSFPGTFSNYSFEYWRHDDSPFALLSDDGLSVITSLEVRSTLPWPLHRLSYFKRRAKFFSVTRNDEHRFDTADWPQGVRELLDAGLIQKAPIADNLELASLARIRSRLREHGLKGGAKKDAAIALAVKGLPAAVLAELVEPITGYVLTPPAIAEFRLQLYGLLDLKASVRSYNSFQGVDDKVTADEYTAINRDGRGTPEFFKVVLALLENARNAPDYRSYLESGMPPVEASMAVRHAYLGDFHAAYRDVQEAYRLDAQYNDDSQTLNVNHFASLVRLQLQLELVLSQSDAEVAERIPETEKTLQM